jgi:hypothetical protein
LGEFSSLLVSNPLSVNVGEFKLDFGVLDKMEKETNKYYQALQERIIIEDGQDAQGEVIVP